MKNGISVLDMIDEYTSENNVSELDMFKHDTTSDDTAIDNAVAADEVVINNDPIDTNTSTGEWVPDADLLEDLPEVGKSSTGILFNKEDWKDAPDSDVPVNQFEDEATKHGAEALNEMEFAASNIEKSKQRLGLKHVNFPTMYRPNIMNYAADKDPKVHGDELDALLMSIVETFPDSVVERINTNDTASDTNNTEHSNDNLPTIKSDTIDSVEYREDEVDVKIVIDKSQASAISFDTAELDKIKKSRRVEINIVETKDVKYSIIQDDAAGHIDIDSMLSEYTRKINDKSGTLPASRYNCTFIGLTYGEFLDLSYSNQVNSVEGEILKWNIAYRHIKNPSIGEFKSFDDFLAHTSFIDLNYILWNILCVTCMNKEVISIDCKIPGCNKTYDWVYNPESLLDIESISDDTAAEVAKTSNCKTIADAIDNYNQSLVAAEQLIELHSSKFVICFGHVSAKEYLESRLGVVESFKEPTDPESAEVTEMSVMEALISLVVKYVLLPDKGSDKYHKITDPADIIKVIHSLDVIDYQTIFELYDKLVSGYTFKFSLRDVVCPECKNKTTIEIKDISDLLFFLSRSLDAEITFTNS